MVERCPQSYRLVQCASCLFRQKMAEHPGIGEELFDNVLIKSVNVKRNSSEMATKSKREFYFLAVPVQGNRLAFKEFDKSI